MLDFRVEPRLTQHGTIATMDNSAYCPNVAVIMAVNNCAGWLPLAIQSVIEQSYTDFELVIVDDGSTDNTHDILQAFARHDKRIRIITKQNTGLGDSLNTAINSTSATYIARMDGDDICHLDRLQKQVAFLDQHPEIDVLGTNAVLIDGSGAAFGTLMTDAVHEDLSTRIWSRNPFIHPTVMMRRHVMETTGGYDRTLMRGQDLDLWLRCRATFRFHNLQEPLLYYRAVHKAKKNLHNAMWAWTVLRKAMIRERKSWWYTVYALRPLIVCIYQYTCHMVRRP